MIPACDEKSALFRSILTTRDHSDYRQKGLTLSHRLYPYATAKEILRDAALEHQHIPDAITMTPDGIIQVDYEDTTITPNLASTIRYQIGKNRIGEWWRFEKRIKPEVMNEEIDGEVMKTPVDKGATLVG